MTSNASRVASRHNDSSSSSSCDTAAAAVPTFSQPQQPADQCVLSPSRLLPVRQLGTTAGVSNEDRRNHHYSSIFDRGGQIEQHIAVTPRPVEYNYAQEFARQYRPYNAAITDGVESSANDVEVWDNYQSTLDSNSSSYRPPDDFRPVPSSNTLRVLSVRSLDPRQFSTSSHHSTSPENQLNSRSARNSRPPSLQQQQQQHPCRHGRPCRQRTCSVCSGQFLGRWAHEYQARADAMPTRSVFSRSSESTSLSSTSQPHQTAAHGHAVSRLFDSPDRSNLASAMSPIRQEHFRSLPDSSFYLRPGARHPVVSESATNGGNGAMFSSRRIATLPEQLARLGLQSRVTRGYNAVVDNSVTNHEESQAREMVATNSMSWGEVPLEQPPTTRGYILTPQSRRITSHLPFLPVASLTSSNVVAPTTLLVSSSGSRVIETTSQSNNMRPHTPVVWLPTDNAAENSFVQIDTDGLTAGSSRSSRPRSFINNERLTERIGRTLQQGGDRHRYPEWMMTRSAAVAENNNNPLMLTSTILQPPSSVHHLQDGRTTAAVTSSGGLALRELRSCTSVVAFEGIIHEEEAKCVSLLLGAKNRNKFRGVLMSADSVESASDFQEDVRCQSINNDVEGDLKRLCAICCAHFTPGEALRHIQLCGHRYHVGCVDRWFETNTTCPICRQDLKTGALDGSLLDETQHVPAEVSAPSLLDFSESSSADLMRFPVTDTAEETPLQSRSNATSHLPTDLPTLQAMVVAMLGLDLTDVECADPATLSALCSSTVFRSGRQSRTQDAGVLSNHGDTGPVRQENLFVEQDSSSSAVPLSSTGMSCQPDETSRHDPATPDIHNQQEADTSGHIRIGHSRFLSLWRRTTVKNGREAGREAGSSEGKSRAGATQLQDPVTTKPTLFQRLMRKLSTRAPVTSA